MPAFPSKGSQGHTRGLLTYADFLELQVGATDLWVFTHQADLETYETHVGCLPALMVLHPCAALLAQPVARIVGLDGLWARGANESRGEVAGKLRLHSDAWRTLLTLNFSDYPSFLYCGWWSVMLQCTEQGLIICWHMSC